jgi:hypothetical protein
MQLSQQLSPDPVVQPAPVIPAGSTTEFQMNGDRFSARTTTPDPDRNATVVPEANLIPEKFGGDVNKLAQAYTELERAFHAKSTPKPADTPTTPAAAPTASAATETPKGLDMGALAQEFTEKGALSEETYTKLAGQGFDKQTVDTFIAGQQALAATVRADIASVAGGEENLNKVLEWAQANLSPSQLAAYEAATATKNVELVKLSLQGIVAAYSKGAEPSFITGSPAPVQGNFAPFQSNAEMVAAINDPRYAKDPAYRNQVAQRLMRSK